jgi:hypothetical protein
VNAFLQALGDPVAGGPMGGEGRSGAATRGLAALGVRAADGVAALLNGRETAPEVAGKAAWILTQLPGEQRDELARRLRDGLDAARSSLADPAASGADRDRMQQKTGTLAWMATARGAAEHDALAGVLLDGLLRTADEGQAGSLIWGLTSLKGLTDDARLRASRALLDAVTSQPDAKLAQSWARAVAQLASGSDRLPDVQRQVQEALDASGANTKAAARLRWLQGQLAGGKR